MTLDLYWILLYEKRDIASPVPNWRRWREERRIGGSYRRVLAKGIYVPQNAVVLEISAGRGSWTRAPLKSMPTYVIHVVDFHDVAQWLQPEKYDGRLNCHVISDNAGCSVFPMSILISAFRSGCSVTTTLTASRKFCVTSFLK